MADDAEGLAHDQSELVGAELVVGVAVAMARQRRRVLPVGDRAADLALDIGDRLAAFEALDPAQLVELRLDAPRHVEQDLCARRTRQAAPHARVGGAPRGRDGASGVRRSQPWVAGDRHPVGRIVAGDLGPACDAGTRAPSITAGISIGRSGSCTGQDCATPDIQCLQ
jgi:hypothetical protein